MTLREQGHRQKDLDRGGGQLNAELDIPLLSEAPFERGPYIVHAGEMGGAVHSVREGGPVAAALFEPLPIIGRMPESQVVGFVSSI